MAALFPVLPGTPPDRTNLGHIRACGAALAELHAALLGLDVGMPPAVSAMYGELERIHPLVPDPWSLPDALPLELDEREQLRRVFEMLRGEIPGLYAALPRQVCHNDYGPGNTLAIDGKTSAILDFEFAGPDVRAIDVAVGWYWSVGPRWGARNEMVTIRAFLAGYGSWASGGRLTAAEAEVMPVLARLHGAAGLVHWVGRGRAGLAGEERVLEHAQRLLDLDRWLDTHAAELIVATGAVSRR